VLLAISLRLTLAGVDQAGLAALRRVDAMEPDTLPLDLKRVAVDHRGDANHVGMHWEREQHTANET
jgi:hypothetical protein